MTGEVTETDLAVMIARVGDALAIPRFAMAFAIALRALWSKPLRATLTTLGVILGVASMVIIAAIGEAAKWQIEKSVSSISANMIVITAVPDGNPAGIGAGRLSLRDIAALREAMPEIRAAAPQMLIYASLVAGNANSRATVTGITDDYMAITGARIARGRALNERDASSRRPVMVIGATIARHLFADADPFGRSIRVNNVPFEIVGILEARGKSLSGDLDDLALIPLATAMQRFRAAGARAPDAVDLAFIAFDEAFDQNVAIEQVRDILRQRYRVAGADIEPFTIASTTEIREQSRAILTAVQLGLVGIAAISLLVGSIGITNIMLVSVSERTREIGLRMAIGARRRDIRNQFLVEATILCLLGGVIGLATGAALAFALSALLEWPFIINSIIVLVALGISVLVGVAAGLWPAMRASRLTPMEALRYE